MSVAVSSAPLFVVLKATVKNAISRANVTRLTSDVVI